MLAGIGIKIGLALGAASIVASGYFYVQSLRSDLGAAEANTARAMDVVSSQGAVLDQLKTDIKRMQTVTGDLSKKLVAAEKNVQTLNNKFDTNSSGQARDIGKDAVSSPLAVEKVINRATKDAMRCGELVTGAEPLPGETNSQCPDLLPLAKANVAPTAAAIRSTIK